MKYYIITVFLFMTLKIVSQTNSNHKTEHYFEFRSVPDSKLSKGDRKTTIIINFGQKYLNADSIQRKLICDSIESFKKVSDALEYMNSMGWQLVTAYATSYNYFNTFYYVMKKEE